MQIEKIRHFKKRPEGGQGIGPPEKMNTDHINSVPAEGGLQLLQGHTLQVADSVRDPFGPLPCANSAGLSDAPPCLHSTHQTDAGGATHMEGLRAPPDSDAHRIADTLPQTAESASSPMGGESVYRHRMGADGATHLQGLPAPPDPPTKLNTNVLPHTADMMSTPIRESLPAPDDSAAHDIAGIQPNNGHTIPAPCGERLLSSSPPSGADASHLRDIFNLVKGSGTFNSAFSRVRVPSGLNVEAWREYLAGYQDQNLVDYLEFGWPVGFSRAQALHTAESNHPSATKFPQHVSHYIQTEIAHGALLGPFDGPPMLDFHLSPLMTRPKRDSPHRRVIVDLSFPHHFSVNDGIDPHNYVDGPMSISLPTVHTLERRVLELGRGCYLYKSDLARGYRQLRIDPYDWDLLGFSHEGKFYVDICPPFGLRSSAMMMVRTTQAVVHIHDSLGYTSLAYIDDFGGAEPTVLAAQGALHSLQGIFATLGLEEAQHKVCPPTQVMTWLGIEFNTLLMTMSLPERKIRDVRECLDTWAGKIRATLKEIQSLFGLLQFVTAVAPQARLFTNRILEALRELSPGHTTALSWGFRRDLAFFADLMPTFRGVKIMDKQDIPAQHLLELDACLSGCGAVAGDQFYGRKFPPEVADQEHPIARLEMLNIVVALKVWAHSWEGYRVRIHCDNMNSVLVLQTGRARDPYMQNCAREAHLITAQHDVCLLPVHCPGAAMTRADALSREHLGAPFNQRVRDDPLLQAACRVHPPDDFFQLQNDL